MDEQWSFVGNKKNQRWLFYAWEPRLKRAIAHAFGRRVRILAQLEHRFW
ncbi:IS1 family transposase [Kistimonas scapharcae]